MYPILEEGSRVERVSHSTDILVEDDADIVVGNGGLHMVYMLQER